jgi:dTDP-glucose 4,6-dehydratase
VLQQTGALWEELRGRRLFLTGGTGFFGRWLLESFARANDVLGLGADAVILTRDPAAFAAKAPHLTERRDLEFIAGDIRTFAFPPGKFSHVIHAATETSAKLNAEAPAEMLDVICTGTRRVLDFAAAAGVRKLLLTSSGAVYGRQPAELIRLPEDYAGAPDPLLAGSAYGEGKRLAEHLCVVHARQHGYEAKIARCFAFVGPHLPLDAHFAIGNFIRDALRGGPINVNGDGTPVRSYLYASDLAIWLWTILCKGQAGRAYNVGSDETISIADLAHLVGGLLGAEVRIAAAPVPGAAPARYVPDTGRAQQELHLRAWTGGRAAIEKTARWHGGMR